MASRPILSPHLVIVNGDMSGNITSQVTIIQNLSLISYDVAFTGAPVGTFSVQVSNTYAQNAEGGPYDPGDWATMPLSGMPTATGSSGNGIIDILATGTYAMRLVYTAASGSGTLNAVISGKVS